MPSIDEIIQNMPEIRKGATAHKQVDLSVFLNKIVELLKNNEAVNKAHLVQVAGYLDSITQAVSKEYPQLDLEPVVKAIKDSAVQPNVVVDNSAVAKAIGNLKFPEPIKQEFPKSLEVSNLSQVVSALQELKNDLEQAINDIRIPDKIEAAGSIEPKDLEPLRHLENLKTSATKPITVRLSDGKKHYDAIAQAVKEMRHGIALPIPAFKTVSGDVAQGKVDDNGFVKTTSDNYAIKIAYVPSGNGVGEIEYVGKAVPGSVTSSSVWQIQKMTYNASNKLTDVQWHGGNDYFDNVWDNRGAGTYS